MQPTNIETSKFDRKAHKLWDKYNDLIEVNRTAFIDNFKSLYLSEHNDVPITGFAFGVNEMETMFNIGVMIGLQISVEDNK